MIPRRRARTLSEAVTVSAGTALTRRSLFCSPLTRTRPGGGATALQTRGPVWRDTAPLTNRAIVDWLLYWLNRPRSHSTQRYDGRHAPWGSSPAMTSGEAAGACAMFT